MTMPPRHGAPGDDRDRRAARRAAASLSGGAVTGSALVDLVYRELHDLAGGFLARERPDHTLAPTALVHEAWLRLAGQERVSWEGRDHFLAIAAIAMRRVLVDHARAHGAERRGGGVGIEPLATEVAASLRKEGLDIDARIDLLTLDEGLDRLRERSERASRIVELRFFGGLTEQEVAQVMGIARSTVTLEWKAARAWLSAWMNRGTAERAPKDQEPT